MLQQQQQQQLQQMQNLLLLQQTAYPTNNANPRLGPRGNPWKAVGDVGKMMQVGGNIIGGMLRFGAIAEHLMPAVASAGALILG